MNYWSPHLKVSKLGELLSAVIQETSEWFGMLMGDLVSTDVASLSKSFLTYITRKWLFSSMASLMSLIINCLC